MATYFYPERDHLNHIDCLSDTRLHRYAQEALNLLKHFPELWVFDIQVKPPHMPNACFYTYPRNDDRTRLLNLTIIPSDLRIEFRMAQYLPADVFHRLQWQNKGSNKAASLSRFGQEKIVEWIRVYMSNLWPEYQAGRIRRAGASAMEGIIANYMALLYPHDIILRNHRPDTMRSQSNRPLELDIFLPQQMIAVEVQGPRHIAPDVAQRDCVKIELCRIHKIGLLSIEWERARSELLSLPLKDVLTKLQQMIEEVRTNGSGFVAY